MSFETQFYNPHSQVTYFPSSQTKERPQSSNPKDTHETLRDKKKKKKKKKNSSDDPSCKPKKQKSKRLSNGTVSTIRKYKHLLSSHRSQGNPASPLNDMRHEKSRVAASDFSQPSTSSTHYNNTLPSQHKQGSSYNNVNSASSNVGPRFYIDTGGDGDPSWWEERNRPPESNRREKGNKDLRKKKKSEDVKFPGNKPSQPDCSSKIGKNSEGGYLPRSMRGKIENGPILVDSDTDLVELNGEQKKNPTKKKKKQNCDGNSKSVHSSTPVPDTTNSGIKHPIYQKARHQNSSAAEKMRVANNYSNTSNSLNNKPSVKCSQKTSIQETTDQYGYENQTQNRKRKFLDQPVNEIDTNITIPKNCPAEVNSNDVAYVDMTQDEDEKETVFQERLYNSVVGELVCHKCRLWMSPEEIRSCFCKIACLKCTALCGTCQDCHFQFTEDVKLSKFHHRVANRLTKPCRYEGCTYFVKPGDNHELYCEYEPFLCFKCKRSIPKTLAKWHFETEHHLKEKNYGVKVTDFQVNPDNGQNEICCYTSKGHCVYLTINKFEKDENAQFIVTSLGENEVGVNVKLLFKRKNSCFHYACDNKPKTNDILIPLAGVSFIDVPKEAIESWMKEDSVLDIFVRGKRRSKIDENRKSVDKQATENETKVEEEK